MYDRDGSRLVARVELIPEVMWRNVRSRLERGAHFRHKHWWYRGWHVASIVALPHIALYTRIFVGDNHR